MRNRIRHQSEPRKPWQPRCLPLKRQVHSVAQTAHSGDATERPLGREPKRSCVPQGQPFLGYVIIPPGVEKSLSQLRCSVGEAIDRRSRHVPHSGALFIESCFQSPWGGRVGVLCALGAQHEIKGTCECEEHTNRWWRVDDLWSSSTQVVPRCAEGSASFLGGFLSFQKAVERGTKCDSNLVDSASSHTLVSKIKPCMSKYKRIYTVKLRTAH